MDELHNCATRAKDLRPARNRLVHSGDMPLPSAVERRPIHTTEASTMLEDIEAVPIGAPRLATLELAKTRLDRARQALGPDDSPIENRLRTVTVAISHLIDQAASSMLGPVSIRIETEPKDVVVGVPQQVSLLLRNESQAGLRTLSVTTRPDVGRGEVPYLAEAASTTLPLTIYADSSAQPFRVTVSWNAIRLDGARAQGEENVDLLVRSTRAAVRASHLGASPYIVGNPIDREEMFYGRTDVIDQIRRQLGSATRGT